MEITRNTKTLINGYRNILLKTNDDIIMHDLLETMAGGDTRSRVDLRTNNYVLVLDINFNTLYVSVASEDIDIKRLEEDIITLNNYATIVTLIVNNAGRDIVLNAVYNSIKANIESTTDVCCMELQKTEWDEPVHILRKANIEDKTNILNNILEEANITKESKFYDYAKQDVTTRIINGLFYVLTKDEAILAQAYIFEDEYNVFIHGVLTNKNIRNKGVATDMMNQLTNELAKLNKKIYLSVFDNNVAAKRTYDKVGFKQIGLSHCFFLT